MYSLYFYYIHPRSDGSWYGPKSPAKWEERRLLRGSSQQEGASSALVVSYVSIFCYCFKIHQEGFSKNAKNVDFSLWGKRKCDFQQLLFFQFFFEDFFMSHFTTSSWPFTSSFTFFKISFNTKRRVATLHQNIHKINFTEK